MTKKIVKVTQVSTTYSATGRVVGNLWGGGKGSYSSRTFSGRTKLNVLIKEITEGLANGSLDGGMGFESLISATMFIVTKRTILVNNKFYINTQEVKRVFKNK